MVNHNHVQFLLGSLLKWRTIAAISTVFPVISITALFFVPESPHWLITKGRYQEAQHALAWLRGWVPIAHIQHEYQQIYDIHVTALAAAKSKQSASIDHHSSSYLVATLQRYGQRSFLRPYALITLTFFIGHFSGKTTLQTYAVQIFHTLKAPIDKYYATVLLGAVEIVGTLVCVVLVHCTGKRPLVLMSLVGCGLCFFGTATYARFLDAVPGVVLENVVANVSAVSFIRDGALNQSAYGEQPYVDADAAEQMMRNYSDDPMMVYIGSENATFTVAGLLMQSNDNSSVSLPPADDGQLTALPDQILLHIPNVEVNRYSWVPLTLLLMSAFFAHMGIKLIPWMLIGEVLSYLICTGCGPLIGLSLNPTPCRCFPHRCAAVPQAYLVAPATHSAS